MKKNILITGGAGFIGSHVVRLFVNKYPNCDKPIALFKGGTGNDFYWKLFGERSRQAHLDAVLAGHVENFDAGSCNGQLFLNGAPKVLAAIGQQLVAQLQHRSLPTGGYT